MNLENVSNAIDLKAKAGTLSNQDVFILFVNAVKAMEFLRDDQLHESDKEKLRTAVQESLCRSSKDRLATFNKVVQRQPEFKGSLGVLPTVASTKDMYSNLGVLRNRMSNLKQAGFHAKAQQLKKEYDVCVSQASAFHHYWRQQMYLTSLVIEEWKGEKTEDAVTQANIRNAKRFVTDVITPAIQAAKPVIGILEIFKLEKVEVAGLKEELLDAVPGALEDDQIAPTTMEPVKKPSAQDVQNLGNTTTHQLEKSDALPVDEVTITKEDAVKVEHVIEWFDGVYEGESLQEMKEYCESQGIKFHHASKKPKLAGLIYDHLNG